MRELLFMEAFAEQLVRSSNRTFIFDGVPLDATDVASARGMLPAILSIARVQAAVCVNALPEEMHHFLFGWLDAFDTVPDQDTLTGIRVTSRNDSQSREMLRYTAGAALVVAFDFMIENSETQTINLDPFVKEFFHVGTEGMRLSL